MKLDNEEQRALLIQLLDMATFPGVFRQRVYALGVAVETADLIEDKKETKDDPIR